MFGNNLLKISILVLFVSCKKDRTITCVKADGTTNNTIQHNVTKKQVEKDVNELNSTGSYGNCTYH